ncbi:MAG: hypothetical protein WC747_00110 [Candidatus Babeliales bacterium]|jgi:hypothetical protein
MKLFRLLVVSSLLCSSLLVHASNFIFEICSSRTPQGQAHYRTIFVQTANNKKIPCSADQNIKYFFEQCRHQGDCKGEQLTLVFDNYEIKEGTEAANKRFNEYKTNVKEAFVQESHHRSDQTSPTRAHAEFDSITNSFSRALAMFIWYGDY